MTANGTSAPAIANAQGSSNQSTQNTTERSGWGDAEGIPAGATANATASAETVANLSTQNNADLDNSAGGGSENAEGKPAVSPEIRTTGVHSSVPQSVPAGLQPAPAPAGSTEMVSEESPQPAPAGSQSHPAPAGSKESASDESPQPAPAGSQLAPAPAGATESASDDSEWSGWAIAHPPLAPADTTTTTTTTMIDAAAAMAKCVCLYSLGSHDPECFKALPCDVTPECSTPVASLNKCILEDQQDVCADFSTYLESEEGPWGEASERNCRDALVEEYKASGGADAELTDCVKSAATACVERCQPCWTCNSADGCMDTRGEACSDSCDESSYCNKFSHCAR